VFHLLYCHEPDMQIERGKPANSGLHGLDRAAGRGVEQREEPACMHGSEVLYCHSAGEPSKMERRSAASTSEMPNAANDRWSRQLTLQNKPYRLEAARRSNKGRICTLTPVNTGDDIKKFIHAYSPICNQSVGNYRGAKPGLSKERLTVYGGLFPWPGVGHVAEEKDEFRYFSEATK
jgi:hypothetical protein